MRQRPAYTGLFSWKGVQSVFSAFLQVGLHFHSVYTASQETSELIVRVNSSRYTGGPIPSVAHIYSRDRHAFYPLLYVLFFFLFFFFLLFSKGASRPYDATVARQTREVPPVYLRSASTVHHHRNQQAKRAKIDSSLWPECLLASLYHDSACNFKTQLDLPVV